MSLTAIKPAPHPPSATVLCVDDDPMIRQLLEECLAPEFDVLVAESGEAGLRLLAQRPTIAVVVADLTMPNMSGSEFLRLVRERAPNAVRVMLTGCGNVEVAAEAMNTGQVFRFVTKPCNLDVLLAVVRECVAQQRVLLAERHLLKHTLRSAIRVLTHVLSQLQPAAFGRAERLAGYVSHMATALELEEAWLFEMAARLSHLGWVTLPPEVIAKVYAGEKLSEREQEVFSFHPYVAYELLSTIPRLEEVAEMVLCQQETAAMPLQRGRAASRSGPIGTIRPEVVEMGAQLLAVAMAFDRGTSAGRSFPEVTSELRSCGFDPRLVNALDGLDVPVAVSVPCLMRAADLQIGMKLDQDIHSKLGILLVAKGQEVTLTMIHRLRRMSEEATVREPFRVLVGP